ncbi:uncharacterized protein zgc:113208 [Megalobrama amblycephala]|uniref:uncharacterized protein zgc:113208 n=1 Tax=Megalobrama amblycephala TaxID=75352 RepID=UPI0020143392|nr:uncharacterized protein zgc:113208 [Megalobrama amblycephala]
MSDEDERDGKKMKRKKGPDDSKAPVKKRQKINDKNEGQSSAVKKPRALAGKADSTKTKVKLSGKDKDKEKNKDYKKNNSDGGKNASEIKRNEKGQLVFKDHTEFTPNMSPKEVLQAGSFGGTYFRPIYSSITKQHYKDVWQELPEEWLDGLDISKQVASSTYRENVNTYNVKCGGSLEMWESSGWIVPQDPYGWFQWYCRFYQGRRTVDDARQISRWAKCAGLKGRWRQNLITKVVRSGCAYDNPGVSPVVRQTLQHWGYKLTLEDYKEGAKRVKLK